ncbi:MAG: class I SAM-dependent methyltransferase [Candidatus Melainabacteria bacterium]
MVHLDYWTTEASHWWYRARRTILKHSLDGALKPFSENPSATVLDVGSGGGAMLGLLAHYGQVTLTEPDAGRLLARQASLQQRAPDTKFVTEGWATLSFPESSFDVLTAFDVLEHLEDDHAALACWLTWLKPGGFLVMTVPAFSCLWGKNDVQGGHYRRYTRETLLNVLEAMPLRVVRCHYFFSALFLPAWLSRAVGETVTGDADSPPAEMALPPAWINEPLTHLLALERFVPPALLPPWGTSLLLIAQKL